MSMEAICEFNKSYISVLICSWTSFLQLLRFVSILPMKLELNVFLLEIFAFTQSGNRSIGRGRKSGHHP
jgi:hypothetical protein